MPLAEAKGAAIYPPTPLPRHCEARSTVAACSSSSEADGFSTAGLWHARSSALTSAEQASRSDLVRVRVRVRVTVRVRVRVRVSVPAEQRALAEDLEAEGEHDHAEETHQHVAWLAH